MVSKYYRLFFNNMGIEIVVIGVCFKFLYQFSLEDLIFNTNKFNEIFTDTHEMINEFVFNYSCAQKAVCSTIVLSETLLIVPY